MRVAKIVVLSLWACLLLSACQQQPPQVLPTVRSVESAQTEAAQTQAALPTPTPTATARFQLPPTFTPTPLNTPTPTQAPLQSQSSNSRFYYLYNDDSIAVVNADGSDNAIVVTLGVGQTISEYALSPDLTKIAFVAPGAGSGREVYISDISGTNIQKLSCLGYADVRGVVWTPDSTQLVFFAAPTSVDAGNIYIMQSANGQGCPNSNSMRILAPIQARDFRSMTFNRTGSLLFYAGGGEAIYTWDMVTNARARASAEPAFGPDAAPRQNPITDELVFLRQQIKGAQHTGSLVRLEDSREVPETPYQFLGDPYDALDLRWSGDGTLLLMTTAASILYLDTELNRLATLPISGLRLPEAAAANRDAIAYTAYDATNVIQIFIYDLNREQIHQVTQNPEGLIRSITWVEGP
jgi:WD40 repeat protein